MNPQNTSQMPHRNYLFDVENSLINCYVFYDFGHEYSDYIIRYTIEIGRNQSDVTVAEPISGNEITKRCGDDLIDETLKEIVNELRESNS